MSHEPLEQLLRDADDDAVVTPVRTDLAGQVRQVAAGRARRARLATGGAIIGCIALLAVWVARPGVDPQSSPVVVRASNPPDESAKEARAALLALAEEADRRAAAAEAMWKVERRATKRTAIVWSADVADQIERAAFTMVYQAARMPAAGGEQSPAATVYREVSRAFPDAPSAQVARQRLSELANRKDG
jgi:hypothetical protein